MRSSTLSLCYMQKIFSKSLNNHIHLKVASIRLQNMPTISSCSSSLSIHRLRPSVLSIRHRLPSVISLRPSSASVRRCCLSVVGVRPFMVSVRLTNPSPAAVRPSKLLRWSCTSFTPPSEAAFLSASDSHYVHRHGRQAWCNAGLRFDSPESV